ncbi:MAG: type II toxin-antitoxin system HicB family antitoxin [Spirochaetales bacterium]|nr:type II toxin-antitoxin system HicB family antitoxin [Spirochaetales bacterium]
MKHSLKFEVYHDGAYYCARCFDFDIFTQGSTLDEVTANIKEAVQLYFEDSEKKEVKDNYDGILTVMEMAM